jgi:hypothetical protein
MALTTFEKDMLTRQHDAIQKRQRRGKASAQDETDLGTILGGTEAVRRLLIEDYVENVAIPECSASITACDTTKSALQTELATMQAYLP